jgi:hypothetical protein
MARQRKPLPVDHINPKYLKKNPTQTRKEGIFLLYWKQGMAFICLLIAGVIAYMGYLETRVNTPFDEQKVCTICKNLIEWCCLPFCFYCTELMQKYIFLDGDKVRSGCS